MAPAARADAQSSPAPSRRHPAAAGLAGLALAGLLLALLAGAGGATVPAGTLNASNDTAAPTVGNLTKVNATTVELVIEDDTDVDEASIDGADLFVSDGRIANVSATENGSNATVAIELESRLDTDRLGVAVADGSSIYDAADNQLDASGDVWRYVNGMDTVAPSVTLYDVDASAGDRVDVTVRATEDLDGLWVRLYGPADVFRSLANFTKPSGISEYETTVEPPATGSYRVTLLNVTDEHNNTRETGRHETVSVDVAPPTAVAGIDFAATEGRTVTFDANRSSDDSAIRNVTWDFGDGTNATGWGPTHTYAAGNYTVELTVTDAFGNVATDSLQLNLTGRNASEAVLQDVGTAVSISPPRDGTPPSAIVTVRAPTAGDPVEIAREANPDAPLAATGSVALDRLTMTLASNDSLSLGIQATGPAAVSDVAAAADGEALGGFTLVHDVPERAVQSARFAVGVDERSLASAGIEPAAVRLWRYHDGDWVALSTTALNETDGVRQFRATAPGLSRFAIAPAPAPEPNSSTPTPPPGNTSTGENATEPGNATDGAAPTPAPASPDLQVVAASLNRSEVDPGTLVRINASVLNRGDAQGSVTAALHVGNATAATQSVTVGPGRNRSISFAYATNRTGAFAVAVNDTAAGTLVVGNPGGGGGLFGLLGIFGFLPLDLLGALVTYLGGVLAALFLLLKAAALGLGY